MSEEAHTRPLIVWRSSLHDLSAEGTEVKVYPDGEAEISYSGEPELLTKRIDQTMLDRFQEILDELKASLVLVPKPQYSHLKPSEEKEYDELGRKHFLDHGVIKIEIADEGTEEHFSYADDGSAEFRDSSQKSLDEITRLIRESLL